MSNEPDLNFLIDQIHKLVIFLERPSVQIQLVTIAISFLGSKLIAQWVLFRIRKKNRHLNQLTWRKAKGHHKVYILILLRHLLTSILCLIFIKLFQILLTWQGWEIGIFRVALEIFWSYFFYRFFLMVLYNIFSIPRIHQYQSQFFAPLFVLFVFKTIINLISSTEALSQVVIIKLFGSPITIEAIFLSTVGLYLWIRAVDILQHFILKCVSSTKDLESGTAQAFLILLRYFLIGLGIVLIFGYVNFNTTAFAAITGGLSVGIGFGLKEVFSNFISGIILLFEGALKPGDIIEIDGESSQVKKLNFRSTIVQVFKDNSEKIIPNQNFFTQNITTYTGSNRLIRRSIKVGTSYDCNPQKVVDLLLQIATQNSQILKEPPPLAFFVNFGDSSLNFELNFWLDDPLIGKTVASQIGCEIWKNFAEYNIQIPYPQRDLHIRSCDDSLNFLFENYKVRSVQDKD